MELGETRTQKSLRNAKWGIVAQLVTILTNLVVRTVFLRCLGVAFNGLNSLMAEVIAILSMAEMGFGTAITFHLYKPLASGDSAAVSRLLGLYKNAYRAICGIVLLLGALVIPFIPRIVTGTEFSDGYIRIVFALFVVQTAGSYLLSYKRAIFNADQRGYIVTLFTIAIGVITAIAGVFILLFSRNYLLFLALQIVMTLSGNAVILWYANRSYPFLREKPAPVAPEEKRVVMQSIRNLFIGLVSGKITSSTDNILISVLVSTNQIGIYSNYAMINTAVLGLFRKLSASMSASMGNLYATATQARTETAFRRMEFIFGTAALAVSLMMYAAATPFVRLWLGDDYIISEAALFSCMINQFFFIAREPLWQMSVASGLFSIDKYVSILGSAVNLVVSIVLGRIWGMVGIFVGTTCTLVIQIVLKDYFLYKKRLALSPRRALASWGLRTALYAAGAIALRYVSAVLPVRQPLIRLLIMLAASGLLSAAMILLFYVRTPEFAYCKGMVLERLRRKGKA